MLRTIHPLTSLGALLLITSIPFLLVGETWLGILMLTGAYGAAAAEFKKYTSDFQFAMLMVSGPALGIVLDQQYHTWPLETLVISMAAFATIARQKYMQQFTYVNLLWLDSGLALSALGLHVWAVYSTTFDAFLWLPPLLPIGGALFLTAAYVQDGFKIKRSVQGGYRIAVGAEAPDFELPDENGALLRLSSLRGKCPVLLIFVRGDWCPGCHMMLRTYERNREVFMSKGVHVLGIGPDDISVNKDMVGRIGVGFRMLSDTGQSISTKYGVVYTNPAIELMTDYSVGIPLPASFLVDIDGLVRYVSRPERVGEFLDPALIFKTLDALPARSDLAWN
ncbi:MAG: redoxin domain-containing protein [Flavobacteriales bacterium]|nr:redoxin domain-containing protein [Flavobacteriales bacterium]